MIIVTGLPFSGTRILMEAMKCGGLKTAVWKEIKFDKKESIKQKAIAKTIETVNNDQNECIEIPIITIKHIEGQHKFIVVERNLNECFELIKKNFNKEPNKTLLELYLKDVKRYFKIQKKDVTYMRYNKLTRDLKKIKYLIPSFDRAVKETFNDQFGLDFAEFACEK